MGGCLRLSGRSPGLPASWDASVWEWVGRICQSVKVAGCVVGMYILLLISVDPLFLQLESSYFASFACHV